MSTTPGYSARFLPDFYSTASSFTVVLKNVNYFKEEDEHSNSDGGISGGLNGGISDGLNEAQQNILRLLAELPAITTKSAADMLGMPIRSIERHIAMLKQSGRLEREGARKNGRWVVKQEAV